MRTISFSKTEHEEFYKVLRGRVSSYFKTNNISRYGNANMVAKTVFMLALYFIPFILMLTVVENIWLNLFMWTIMGFGMAGLGLSVMHDANHGAYSKHTKVNRYVGWILFALGGSDVNWRIQHNVLHHTYTNIADLDEDIHAPSPLLRFNPHDKLRKIHRFQFIYAWPLYGLMTIMWFISKDYTQTIRYTKMDLIKSQGISLFRHWTTLILTKVLYAFVFIALPIMLTPVPWYICIIGFVIMQFLGGLILALIFQPAHVVPSSDYPEPNAEDLIDSNWAVHQLHTTANFAPKSRIFSWFVGGLNYQVEHHLFPNICHVHYRKISKIVRETAMEYNLPYYYNDTFVSALGAHGKMLFDLGRR